MDNCCRSTKQLLKLLKVRHTNSYLKDSILSHQDHNSLLTIADTLTKYNIKNVAIKIDNEKFDELPLPCVIQVSVKGRKLFYVLNNISDTNVKYYDQNNKLQTSSKEEFLKIWTSICLLAETNAASKEVDIEKKLATKRIQTILLGIALTSFLIWITFGLVKPENYDNFSTISYTIIYTLLKLTGLTVGVLLLWFEVDQYNPTLQSFCSGGKKVNCNAVLKSRHATLFNGSLSLSVLGFSYFFASLLFLVINKFSLPTLNLVSWLSFTTLPIIFISVYYQAFVLKQWCKFCIVFQITLFSEILISFFGNFFKGDFVFQETSLLLGLFLTPIIAWKFLKPLLEQEKEIHIYKRGLKKIKSNPVVLESLLSKSDKITHSSKGLGIAITNENAKYNVIKVCNPYCGPCAKAHPILESLVHAGKINLQMLFMAKTDGIDKKAKPVSHFLSIDSKEDKKQTQQALNDWYSSEKKDYDIFASKYPMNGELEKQNDKINSMREWCDVEKISHTPTLFINGFKLPKEYSIEDLKEVLL